MSKNERNILAVTSFGHFMSHFNMLVFPALVLPLADQYGMPIGEVLALSFWMYMLFGLTALPWGLASDAIGAKPLLLVFYAGAGACGLAASSFLDSPGIFAVCLAGIGLFSGIYHPAGLGLISRGMTRMSMAMGYNGIAGNAGLAVAPILTGVINHAYGCKGAYLFLGVLNLVGAALMLFMPTAEPEKKERTDNHPVGTLAKGFMVLCIVMMLGGIAYRSATVVLPSYFELNSQAIFDAMSEVRWFPTSRNVAATALTSLVFVIGMLGQYLGGRFAEKHEPRWGYLIFHGLALPMVFTMAWTADVPLLLATMGYMLFLLGMQPIENTLVAKLTPEKLRHSAYGTKFVLTFGVGSLAVKFAAWVQEGWSLSAVFIAMTGVSLGIILTIILLFRVTRKIKL